MKYVGQPMLIRWVERTVYLPVDGMPAEYARQAKERILQYGAQQLNSGKIDWRDVPVIPEDSAVRAQDTSEGEAS